ncbi:alpha-2-macroglobulin family protein [Paenibacillus sp. FSL R5-0519]|uniref:alpha-2-macroglobulin family protein n=1 Tax=Paenibacillus sp. FSL R5-0519 TaxID=2921648 RepID=UPI0030D8AD1B
MESKKNPFVVTLSLPQKVKANEEFSIKASLKNESLSNLEILSRTRLFTYVIKDSSGNQINSYSVKDGGSAFILNGKNNISEGYTYKIKKSGTYYVSAVAEFSIMDNGNSKDVKITETKKLEVKEI